MKAINIENTEKESFEDITEISTESIDYENIVIDYKSQINNADYSGTEASFIAISMFITGLVLCLLNIEIFLSG